MSELDVIVASHAAGEPVGPLPPEAAHETAALRALCEHLRRAAPTRSVERRTAVLERVRPKAGFSLAWLAAAASIFLALGVLGLALLNRESGYVPAPATALRVPQNTAGDETKPKPRGPIMPAPGGEVAGDQWLRDQLAEVFAAPAGESTGGEPPRMGSDSGGGAAPLHPEGLLPAVFGQAGFGCWYWAEGVDGFRLHAASIVRKAESGLEFDLVRIEYRSADARLLLLQAPDSEVAAARLAPVQHPNGSAFSLEREGSRLLLLSNAREEAALEELAGQLRRVPE